MEIRMDTWIECLFVDQSWGWIVAGSTNIGWFPPKVKVFSKSSAWRGGVCEGGEVDKHQNWRTLTTNVCMRDKGRKRSLCNGGSNDNFSPFFFFLALLRSQCNEEKDVQLWPGLTFLWFLLSLLFKLVSLYVYQFLWLTSLSLSPRSVTSQETACHDRLQLHWPNYSLLLSLLPPLLLSSPHKQKNTFLRWDLSFSIALFTMSLSFLIGFHYCDCDKISVFWKSFTAKGGEVGHKYIKREKKNRCVKAGTVKNTLRE